MVQPVLSATSQKSDQPICSPTSVLYEIDLRNREGLEKILNDASQIANGQAVLWRIEKAGVPASYLFGTVHVIDQSLQELSPSVRAAIDKSKVIAVESARTSPGALSYAVAKAKPLMVSPDRELERILDDDELGAVEKAVSDAGYPAQMALALKPWAATMFLTDSECQRALHRHGLKSVDSLVIDRATTRGIKIVGLETTLEQYQSLASLAQDLQVAWLKASIELYPRTDDISETISELYRFRRLDAVWPLTKEMAPDSGLDDATLESLRVALVDKRNLRMLDRALPLINDGGAFIAVGAMHQIGPHGLVALLREKGFELTAVE